MMIRNIPPTAEPGVPATENALVNLQTRAQQAMTEVGPGDAVINQTLQDMVRNFAAQQFMEAIMFGEPEQTGVPTLTLDGGEDDA